MRRRAGVVLGAAALMGLGVPAAALADVPDGAAKPSRATILEGGEKTSFGRLAAGPARLIVTFADRPGREEVVERLNGLGAVRAIVPEAGIWRLSGRDLDRAAVLRRPRVEAAEWSLARGGTQDPGATTPPPAPVPATPVAPTGTDPFPLGPATPVTDPLFTAQNQWGMYHLQWSTALAARPRPRIAILDSGIDREHPEWGGADSPLVAPYSTIRDVADADDWSLTGHGSHVAGIAAAPADGIGMVGVAPAVTGAGEVIPVQISDRRGRSTDDTMMRGIRWAVRNGAKVINISAGGPGFSQAFEDTVLWATQRGALIVASVGNEGADVNGINYPAAYTRVLGVGAQCDGNVTFDCPSPFGAARFSNHNRTVDVIAPGVQILSTIPRNVGEGRVTPGYGVKDGTSMATPFVTGLASLVMANNPVSLSAYQVHRQITNTATDVGPAGRDDASGYGVVNPLAAVTLRPPADDPDEVNDDVKFILSARPSAERGTQRVIQAQIDQNEDTDDVYGVVLRKGERVRAEMTYPGGRGQVDLYLWRPTTRTVRVTGEANLQRNLIDYSGRKSGRRQVVSARATASGRHFVNVFARRGGGPYTVTITVTR